MGQLPRCKVSSNPESMDECINVISKIRSETKPLPLKGSKHRVQRLLPQFHTPGYLYQEPPCALHWNDHAAHPKEARLLWRPSLPFSSRLSIQGAGRETRTQFWPLPDPPTPSSRNARGGGVGEWIGLQKEPPHGGAGRARERLKQGLCGVLRAGEPRKPAPPVPFPLRPAPPLPRLAFAFSAAGKEADQAPGSAASQLDGLARGTQPPRAGR